MGNEYKKTLTLPNTKFPMKANLTQREPEFLKRWEQENLYEQILESRKDKPLFILHDGPPYANGQLHLGTALNKTLKDFVVKSKTMAGFRVPYVPGWDCHGLPIEHQVVKKLGSKRKSLDSVALRKECRTYAQKFVDIQRKGFRRLGIFAEWENPYLTMNYEYQAQIEREFGKMVEEGYVYRRRRAIHWCASCETALAEAEIEYADHTSPSIFVAYPIVEGWEELGLPEVPKEDRLAMIWTTTPWTLPASMAIAYSPRENYVIAKASGVKGHFLVAEKLVEAISKAHDISLEVVASVGESDQTGGLSKLKARHPWIDREIPFLAGDHVTMDTGSGLVHTAPGHGEEDYELGLQHDIEIYSPVLGNGCFESDVEHFAGQHVFKANPVIIDHLKQSGRLFGEVIEIHHSYPHCWRCKSPIIFRATAQWFLSMKKNDLKGKALNEINQVSWIPQWGKERIRSMVEARPDWCLSRQRTWGVPLVSFGCKKCGEYFLSAEAVAKAADIFEQESADAWFSREANDFLPSGTKCPKCGEAEFEKGNDILDVWFDSGSSHAAVLEKRENLSWPGDLYLEGSDQHRGWFQSSLLEGLASRGKAPYRAVITHGFVVDGNGRKMSKSLGNFVLADDFVKQRGSEMLRLWVATENYHDDIRFSDEIMDRVVESYRRIRNTARFALGNLSDFDPSKDVVAYDKLAREMDRWIWERWAKLIQKVRGAYEKYDFHTVISSINEFCVVDLSSQYLDVAKDILYCDPASGPRRRSIQTLLFEIGKGLALFLAPILPVTAEEIWEFLPIFDGKTSSVHLAEFPNAESKADEAFVARWERLLLLKSVVSKALEDLRKSQKIGQSLEARVEIVAEQEDRELLGSLGDELPLLWIVSRVKVVEGLSSDLKPVESEEVPGFKVGVAAIEGERCPRCWTYAETLGKVSKHPELCERCAKVMEG